MARLVADDYDVLSLRIMTKRIAIVGGGPSAFAVIIRLSSRVWLGRKVEVSVFEKDGLLSSSFLASRDSVYLMNTTAEVSSIKGGDEMDFTNWLSEYFGGNSSPPRFVSRSVYRLYLEERFFQAVNQIKSLGGSVDIHLEEVVGIERNEGGGFVVLTNRRSCAFDVVVIATGVKSNDISGYGSFRKSIIVHDIYRSPDWIGLVPRESTVLVLGSKLSAIDATLFINKYRSDIGVKMLSSSARLPSVRSMLTRHSLVYFKGLANNPRVLDVGWREVFRLAIMELDRVYCDHSVLFRSNEDATVLLRHDIEQCFSRESKWEGVVGMFIEELNSIWHLMDDRNRQGILKAFGSFIERQVSSFPIFSALVIMGLIRQGRLAFHRCSFSSQGDIMKFCNQPDQVIINCSGISSCLDPGFGLGASLVRLGCCIGPRKGLKVDPNSMEVLGSEKYNGLYAMGCAANESFLVTNYVRTLVMHAETLVEHLLFDSEKERGGS